MKNIAIKEIDKTADIATDVSKKVWEYAELSLKEFKSADLYCKVLEENGFEVERGIAGMDTCFKGTFGSGKPYIGILGEFDALSGLSQKASCSVKDELVAGGCGHGCGHNMLGAGSLSAVFGIKKYLEETKKSGTVIFFGCPGEEGGAGKAFMARDNMWQDLDCALTWHPEDVNRVSTGTTLSCIQKEYTFHGIASHAAGDPELGRSALDAVELMNMGVQFLREHMKDSARIHYAITNAGGNSPNVVQPMAKVLYMVRDVWVGDAVALQKRVDKIAEAAAMMTETTLSVQFIDGCANVIPNKVLEELMYENFKQIELPEYTAEEQTLCEDIVKSYEMAPYPLADKIASDKPELYDEIFEATDGGKKSINDFIIPYYYDMKSRPGSTDVGDVSWQTPTAQIGTVCFAAGSPGHSWQNVAVGGSSIGDKGLILAGKVIAATAIDLFENPEIIEKAKAEFAQTAKAGYTCPIEEGAVPVAID